MSYIFTFYYALFNMSGFKTLEVYFDLVFAGVQCALVFQQVPRLGPSRVIVRVETRVRCCPGTGLVHTAPQHGQDDFRVGLAHGLVKVRLIITNHRTNDL